MYLCMCMLHSEGMAGCLAVCRSQHSLDRPNPSSFLAGSIRTRAFFRVATAAAVVGKFVRWEEGKEAAMMRTSEGSG